MTRQPAPTQATKSNHAVAVTMDVDAPPAAVYELIADARRRATWLPELETTPDAPDRPLTKGDRFVGYAELLGHRFVGSSEVVDADPGQGLVEQVVIGARFRTAWNVTPSGDGTSCRVTHEIDIEFPQGPMGRIERWVLARYLVRLQRKGLRRLAQAAAGASKNE